MMPLGLHTMDPALRTNDAATHELRAYLRREYGAGVPWILSQIPRREPVLRRLLRRARGRSRGAPPAARPSADVPAAEPVPSAPPRPGPAPRRGAIPRRSVPSLAAPTECSHLVREDLGEVGTAAITRCVACGLVFVEQPGRAWAIAPPDRAARTAKPAAPELPLLGPFGT